MTKEERTDVVGACCEGGCERGGYGIQRDGDNPRLAELDLSWRWNVPLHILQGARGRAVEDLARLWNMRTA